jgi:ketosteroid isomerase-like protein
MHEQENLQVVYQAYEAFGRGDVPGVLALLTDDVESRTGHEQVEGYFEAFGGAVEVGEFEPMNFFAEEDMVLVLGHYAFRVKSTGKTVDTDWVHAFTLRDRKIARFRGYEDSAAVAAAFTSQP